VGPDPVGGRRPALALFAATLVTGCLNKLPFAWSEVPVKRVATGADANFVCHEKTPASKRKILPRRVGIMALVQKAAANLDALYKPSSSTPNKNCWWFPRVPMWRDQAVSATRRCAACWYRAIGQG